MERLPTLPSRTEQVYRAILDEICEGALTPGTHLVQEALAARLGVSRQPVQQAMALLKADGLVEELGARGLHVAPLDVAVMQDRYEIRALLDELAARKVAEGVRAGHVDAAALRRDGMALLRDGDAAVAAGDVAAMVRHDMAFHRFLYEAAGNPFIASTADPHWRYLYRVMGEVLRHAQPGATIWAQHRAILEAVLRGDLAGAGTAARAHVDTAAGRLAGIFGPGGEAAMAASGGRG
ncbi:MAG: GntR family transcriptional regulator [Rhodobacteraceae bacterium]|nr:GntR family transcriptional regulator [Paracoccaceae bacterium]